MNIIDKAIERLRGKWHQGSFGNYGDAESPVCALGALYSVASNAKSFYVAHSALVDTFKIETGRWVAEFNDAPSTSEEDVILLMKKASARLDEQQGVSA